MRLYPTPKAAGQFMDVCDRFIGSAHNALATSCTWAWFETVTSAGNVNVILPPLRIMVNLLKLGIDRQRSGSGADGVLAKGLIEHDANRNPVSQIGKILLNSPNTPLSLPLERLTGQTWGMLDATEKLSLSYQSLNFSSSPTSQPAPHPSSADQ